jgi:hypothetical protein
MCGGGEYFGGIWSLWGLMEFLGLSLVAFRDKWSYFDFLEDFGTFELL